MHIKRLFSGAAIAMVAGIGSVSADEKFAKLENIPAAAIPAKELALVQGAADLSAAGGAAGIVNRTDNLPLIALFPVNAAPGPQGLERATSRSDHIMIAP